MDFVINTNEARQRVLDYIGRLPIEKRPYRASIVKINPTRSNEQNRYMWFVFESLARELKTDRDTIHDFFSHLFLRVIDKLGDEEFYRLRGTSTLSAAEHSAFMDDVRKYSNQVFGIPIPLPGELDLDTLNF